MGRRREPKGVCHSYPGRISVILGIIHIIAGCGGIAANTIGHAHGSTYTVMSSGNWGGITFIIVGVLGCIAGTHKTNILIKVFMYLSVVAFFVAIFGVGWQGLAGTLMDYESISIMPFPESEGEIVAKPTYKPEPESTVAEPETTRNPSAEPETSVKAEPETTPEPEAEYGYSKLGYSKGVNLGLTVIAIIEIIVSFISIVIGARVNCCAPDDQEAMVGPVDKKEPYAGNGYNGSSAPPSYHTGSQPSMYSR